MNHNKKNNSIPSFETYGIHPVMEAIKAGKKIDRVLIQQGLRNDAIKPLLDLIQEKKIPVQNVPIQKLNRLTKNNHQGVFAFLSMIEYKDTADLIIEVFEAEKNPLFIILDRVSDVRNLGAIARSAECAGAQGIIITAKGSARINAEAIKSSAGALHRIPVCKETNLKNLIKMLQTSDIQVVACTEKTDNLMYEADLRKPTALLMGSEGEGIQEAILKVCDQKMAIPMKGNTESLNVSVAAGIVLYETLRQRI